MQINQIYGIKSQSESDISGYGWYPLYTRSRFEKKACESLTKAGYEAYLPMQKQLRQWSDRKKTVEMPLISSYVFARIRRSDLYDVVKLRGIARYIQFAGRPAIVRDEEIRCIKDALENKTEIEIVDGMLGEGAKVNIRSGAFRGYCGTVIKRKGSKKLVLGIEALNKTLLITVDKGRTEIA